MPSAKNFVNEREALVRRLSHEFENIDLLNYALTHKSASKTPTAPEGTPRNKPAESAQSHEQATHEQANNERLECLGDAVLGMVIAHRLFVSHPELEQDGLTLIRASLVNKNALALIAREIELGRAIRLGPGELRSGGHDRSSILADTLEAVIGAVFLDAGYPAARDLILRLFEQALANASVTKDAKTQLQEWLQGHREALPVYSVEEVTGADHARQYQVRCVLPGREESGLGCGPSRRAAEQAAAAQILDRLTQGPTTGQQA